MTNLLRRASVVLAVLGVGVVALQSGARAQGCGEPFVASRKLPGAQMTIPDTNVSLRMPRGWSGRWGTGGNGVPFYQVAAPPAGADGVVGLVASEIPEAERGKSLEQFLGEAANAFLGAELGLVTESRTFSLGNNCGGRVVFRTLTAEGSVTLVRGGPWIYGVVAKYPPGAAADMRAGIDTMVATAVLAPPSVSRRAAPAAPAPAPGSSQVLGCWERSPDAYSAQSLKFRADGSYSWVRHVTVSAGGMMADSTDEEVGRYQSSGGTMTLQPEGAQAKRYDVKLESGTLKLGNLRFFRC